MSQRLHLNHVQNVLESAMECFKEIQMIIIADDAVRKYVVVGIGERLGQ